MEKTEVIEKYAYYEFYYFKKREIIGIVLNFYKNKVLFLPVNKIFKI